MRSIFRLRMLAAVAAVSLTWNVGTSAQSRGSGQPPPASTGSPEQVAGVIVDALRANQLARSVREGLIYSLPADSPRPEKPWIDLWISAASKKLDASYSGMGRVQLIIYFTNWFSRDSVRLRPQEYDARIEKIDGATVRAFTAELDRLSGTKHEAAKIMMLIAVQDFLFDGVDWKAGNPQRSLTRLRSIPQEAGSRWSTAVNATDPSPTSSELALIAADGLFTTDAFQQQVFDVVFPFAQKLLAAK